MLSERHGEFPPTLVVSDSCGVARAGPRYLACATTLLSPSRRLRRAPTPRRKSRLTSTPTAVPTVAVPAVDVNEIDSLIQRVVASKRLVGLSVGVMQDGKVVLAKGYGFRSLDPKLPVTPTTMFGIGSVTKQFTCSAALLLEQDGQAVDERSRRQILPVGDAAKDITLLELGQHVSGYRDYYPLDFVVREMAKPEPTDTVIARYATRPLDFEPGSRWSYSNTNFLILGKAIEAASGQTDRRLPEGADLHAVGMTRTAFDRTPNDSNSATGYTSYALADPSTVGARSRRDGLGRRARSGQRRPTCWRGTSRSSTARCSSPALLREADHAAGSHRRAI